MSLQGVFKMIQILSLTFFPAMKENYLNCKIDYFKYLEIKTVGDNMVSELTLHFHKPRVSIASPYFLLQN